MGSVIRGLVIDRFDGSGVFAAAGGAVVEGNFIGTDPSGTVDRGNGNHGVRVTSPGNLIGGPANAAQNVMSGNEGSGVSVEGAASTGNVVSNNHIGTCADAGEDLGNTGNGFSAASPGVIVGVVGANGVGRDVGGEVSPNNLGNFHGVFISEGSGNTVGGRAPPPPTSSPPTSTTASWLSGIRRRATASIETLSPITGAPAGWASS